MTVRRRLHVFEVADAAKRVEDRFAPTGLRTGPMPMDALRLVTHAMRQAAHPLEREQSELERPFIWPERGDVLAVLTLADSAREEVDLGEWRAIAYARHLGVEWADIAAAMGYEGEYAKQYAQKRWRTLCGRFGGRHFDTHVPVPVEGEQVPEGARPQEPADDTSNSVGRGRRTEQGG